MLTLSRALQSLRKAPHVVGLSLLLSTLVPPAAGVTPAWAHGGDVSLVHACVQRLQGHTRIVGANEACGPSESAVHWSLTGPPGPQGPAGPAGPPGSEGPLGSAGYPFLQVVDAAGNVVGTVLGLELLNPVVGFKVGELVIALTLVQDKLYGYSVVYFESSDCTGRGYVQRLARTLPATAVGNDHKVYVDDGQAPVVISARSYAQPDACVPVGFNLQVVPATVAMDLDALFTPPFQVQ